MSGRWISFVHAAVSAAALLFSTPSRAADGTFIVRWRTDTRNTNSAYVEVAGIPGVTLRALRARSPSAPEWSRLLSVYVHDGGAVIDPLTPGMAGQYAIEGEALRFHPQFPLAKGVEYRAEFRPGALPGGKPGPEVLAKGGTNTWAPDIIRSGDRYFLYYSAPGPQPKSAIGLLFGKTLDPASPD